MRDAPAGASTSTACWPSRADPARALARASSRSKRASAQRRSSSAASGRRPPPAVFKPIADFDYAWPKELDRQLLEELLTLSFLEQAANVILVGPNGLGKTMIAKNLLHQAILRGHTARFTLASDMLHDLAAQDSSTSARAPAAPLYQPCRALRSTRSGIYPTTPVTPICCSRSSPAAISSAPRSLTTNKPFGEWNQVFPNAACVVTLVDRLVHRRNPHHRRRQLPLKEAQERAARNAKSRAAKKPKKT